MEQEKIGKFIQTLRKDKNLTQAELAEKLNITDRAVSKWERGKSMPDSSLMLDLCKILGISVNELLMGEKIKDDEIKRVSDMNLVKSLTIVEKSKKKMKNIVISFLILGVISLLSFCIYLVYWNGEINLDYNERFIKCAIENNYITIEDYRLVSGIKYTVINDNNSNLTYLFIHSIDYLSNKIKFGKDYYNNIAMLSAQNESYRAQEIINLENIKENEKLCVYYTDFNFNNLKKYKATDLNKFLKSSYLILECN